MSYYFYIRKSTNPMHSQIMGKTKDDLQDIPLATVKRKYKVIARLTKDQFENLSINETKELYLERKLEIIYEHVR